MVNHSRKSNNDELYHHGILGQKWGIRRYQNPDGTLTEEGKRRAAEKYIKYDNYKNENKQKKYEKQIYSLVRNDIKKYAKDYSVEYEKDLKRAGGFGRPEKMYSKSNKKYNSLKKKANEFAEEYLQKYAKEKIDFLSNKYNDEPEYTINKLSDNLINRSLTEIYSEINDKSLYGDLIWNSGSAWTRR